MRENRKKKKLHLPKAQELAQDFEILINSNKISSCAAASHRNGSCIGYRARGRGQRKRAADPAAVSNKQLAAEERRAKSKERVVEIKTKHAKQRSKESHLNVNRCKRQESDARLRAGERESAGKESSTPIPMQVDALKRATPKRAITHTLTTNASKERAHQYQDTGLLSMY